MNELVLAIRRHELTMASIGEQGIYPIELGALNQQCYALLPRSIADNKSEASIKLGEQFPQILSYIQFRDTQGRYLAYQRKGKEEGLLGKWSIGVGGHISQEDFISMYEMSGEDYPHLIDLLYEGTCREVCEETGLDPDGLDELYSVEQFEEAAKNIVVLMTDKTSAVHVGLVFDVRPDAFQLEDMTLDPKEFNNVAWLTTEELKQRSAEFEPWSQELIKKM